MVLLKAMRRLSVEVGQSPYGEMLNTEVLGTSAERFVGWTPTMGTIFIKAEYDI